MGLLTDIVIADTSEADTIGRAGGDHLRRWPCLEAKGADNNVLAALWEVLTDGASGESLAGDELILYMEDGGPWVIHLPDDFRDRLAALSDDQMHPVAVRWAEHEELSFDGATAEDLEPFLRQLAAHSKKALGESKSLLLWMSL